MAWRRIAGRLAISAFLIFHLTATFGWVIPQSPLRDFLVPPFRAYMLPLGLWQSWWMFAPDPMSATALLECEVIDAKGMRHLYQFPKIADLPWWKKMPRFRHPKFTCNLLLDEYAAQRESTSRYVLRQLALSKELYPVRLHLYCRVWDAPPPGQTSMDPMKRPRLQSISSYEFDSPQEVRR